MSDVVQDLMTSFHLRRVQDVAKLFDVRPSTVSMWRKRGLPPRHRLKAIRLATERRVELPASVAGDLRPTGQRKRARHGTDEDQQLTSKADSAHRPARPVWVEIDGRGRLPLPTQLLGATGVRPGDRVLVEIEGNDLRVRNLRSVVAEVQAFVRSFVPDDVSLVDELIAERRREAERE